MPDNARDELGQVRTLSDGGPPPISTLVTAFQEQHQDAVDAIVLRGYLGRSDILTRTREYLRRAKAAEVRKAGATAVESVVSEIESWKGKPPKQAAAAVVESLVTSVGEWAAGAGDAPGDRAATSPAAGPAMSPADEIQRLIDALDAQEELAKRHTPWRLYLTPLLDRYVDFHLSSLLAYRSEPTRERYDMVTVWLRIFEEASQVTVPYRVVQVTNIGPSFAAYLGGDLIDDYLGPSGTGGSAWGDQSSVFGGGKPGTGTRCGVFFGGKPGTGTRCGE
jgi:hypothetical protein